MSTRESRLRDIAWQVIDRHAPEQVSLDLIYAEVERQVIFDDDDLRPPTLKGNAVGYPSWKRNVRNALQREKESAKLVNVQVGYWMLPPPASIFPPIDTEMAWEIVRNEAVKIQSAGTVFRSRKQEHRY
jgi:hypothetical protein